ncbi:MAG: flagellar cap protein FliD N-terminal domain-containing protein, partial [Spirochaetaceae bacterium]
MSDINVPGISGGRMNTNEMVDEIMRAERAPVRRLENRVETMESEQAVWRDFNRSLSDLR